MPNTPPRCCGGRAPPSAARMTTRRRRAAERLRPNRKAGTQTGTTTGPSSTFKLCRRWSSLHEDRSELWTGPARRPLPFRRPRIADHKISASSPEQRSRAMSSQKPTGLIGFGKIAVQLPSRTHLPICGGVIYFERFLSQFSIRARFSAFSCGF